MADADTEANAKGWCSSFCTWVKTKESLPKLKTGFPGTALVLRWRSRLHKACRIHKGENDGGVTDIQTLSSNIQVQDEENDLPHYTKGTEGVEVTLDLDEAEDEEDSKDDKEAPQRKDRKTPDTYVSVAYIGCSLILFYCLAALDYTSETALGNAVIFPDRFRFSNTFAYEPFANVTHPGRCAPCYGECTIDPGFDQPGGLYLLNVRICRGAIHSGVMDPLGGCFGFEFVNSGGSGQIRYSSLDCLSWWPIIEAVFIVSVFVFVLFVPSTDFKSFIYMVFVGWFFLVLHLFRLPRQFNLSGTIANGFFEQVVNQKSQTLFVTIAGSYAMWKKTGSHTVPSAARYPLDAFLFFFVPYWCGIRMDAFDDLIDIGISLTSSVVSNPNKATWFFLFLTGSVLSLSAQGILYYKADIFVKSLRYLVTMVTITLVLSLTFQSSLSFHFHHFAVGLFGSFVFQGQPMLRWAICLQAFSLGMFVNGIVIWEAAPFFDPEERDYVSFTDYVNNGYKP